MKPVADRRNEMSALKSWLLCSAAVAWISLVSAPAVAQTTLVPSAAQWKITGVSENKDVSGIACMRIDASHRCVIAVDEGGSASIARLEGTDIKQETLVPLITTGQELDAEGAAFDPETKFFYVVGSHGRKRHCCESNPAAFNLIRFHLSESATLPAAPLVGAPEVSKPLEAALKSAGKVGSHAGLCLGTKPTKKQLEKGCTVDRKQGANIEGIAIYKRKLYVGLRGPVDGDTAYLVRFDMEQIFGGEPVGTTMAAKLGSADGAKIGIRDLAAVKNGLLILSGPEDDELGQAALFHLDPDQDRLTPLGKISGLPAEAKPEGLLVLEDSDQRYRVLVVSDGVKNGVPTEYEIKK
jgi:hypothetical protein